MVELVVVVVEVEGLGREADFPRPRLLGVLVRRRPIADIDAALVLDRFNLYGIGTR